jgi:hypothetical protein
VTGGYAWTHDVTTKEGVDIRLVGLNTALLCNDDHDYQKLQLGRTQLNRCAAAGTGRPEVVIALTHHPLEWLRDEVLASSWLATHAHLHLSGHIHRAQTQSIQFGTGADLVRIVAGASHDDARSVRPDHGYNISQLARTDEQIFLRHWPRVWSPKKAQFRVDVDAVPEGAIYASHKLRLRSPRAATVDRQPEVAFSAPPPARVTEISPADAGTLEFSPGSGLFSSLDLAQQRFVRLRVPTTSGIVSREVTTPTGAIRMEKRRVENEILIVRDPIRPIEIQIGQMRASRPGGDPGSVPLVDGLTLESVRLMYPLIIGDPSFRWLRMVFAELATKAEVLKYMYESDLDPEIRRLITRNPSTQDDFKAKDCPFCDPDFLQDREISINKGARAINNDFPYGPYFHYIVMPKARVHSWEQVEEHHLASMNFLIRQLLLQYIGDPVPRGAVGVRIGLNSTIRHVVLGKSTRTSAGASVAHVHKQVWGMTPSSVAASDYLQSLCAVAAKQKIDYLAKYMEVLRDCGCVIWDEGTVSLYVPLGQMSVHELQIMVKRKNSGSFVELSNEEITDLSLAELYVAKLYQRMGINSFNELIYLKPFAKKNEDDGFRMICTFITREVDLAVSELNLAYVVDKKPEDTIALVNEHFEAVRSEVRKAASAASA